LDKKDHSELKDHSESIPTNAGSVDATGAHVDRPEAAATHGPGDSFHFKDKISDSEPSDVVELADVGHTPASIGRHENAAGATTCTVGDGRGHLWLFGVSWHRFRVFVR
jgi:hypothetical protein